MQIRYLLKIFQYLRHQKCNEGRKNDLIKKERNKYKRFYFLYLEKRNKKKNSQVKPNDLHIDQNDSQSRTNKPAENEAISLNYHVDDDDNDYSFEFYSDEEDYDSDEYNFEEEEEDSETDSDIILDLSDHKVRDLIILDILHNLGRGHGARFLNETKLYSYELYSKCPSAYKFLCKLFQFPSESTLMRKFNSKVKMHKENLTTFSGLNSVFQNQNKIYSIKEEKIETVLAIDAFAGTVLKKIKDKDNFDEKTKKHVFMFLCCQQRTKIKHFISFLFLQKVEMPIQILIIL